MSEEQKKLEEPKTIQVKNTRSNLFRNIYVDGAYTSFSPSGDMLIINFFCEKPPIPDIQQIDINTGDITTESEELLIEREFEIGILVSKSVCLELISNLINVLNIEEEE